MDGFACSTFSIDLMVAESDTLKWICRKNGRSDLRSRSKSSLMLTWVLFNLNTATASSSRTEPRTQRSIASARRMNALRNALPRSRTGASSAGPEPLGSPRT